MKDKVLGLTYSSQDNTNPQRRKEPPAVEVEMLPVVDVDVAVVVAAAAAELAAAAGVVLVRSIEDVAFAEEADCAVTIKIERASLEAVAVMCVSELQDLVVVVEVKVAKKGVVMKYSHSQEETAMLLMKQSFVVVVVAAAVAAE
jgi:hypothetical protein